MTLIGLRKKKPGNGRATLSNNKPHTKSSSIAMPKLITTKQWPLRRSKNKLSIVSDNSNTMNNGYDDDQSLNTNHDNDDLVSPPRVISSTKKLDEHRCISNNINNSTHSNSRTSSMNTTNAIIEDDSIAQRLMKEDVTGIRLISKRVSLSQFIEKDKIALNEDDETTASISSNEKSKQESEEDSLISKPKSDTSLSRLLTSNPHKNEEGTIYEEEKFCVGTNNTCLEVLSVFIIEPITTCCNIMGYVCDPIVSGDIFNMQYCGNTEGGCGVDKLCGCDGNSREWEDDTVKSVNSYGRR